MSAYAFLLLLLFSFPAVTCAEHDDRFMVIYFDEPRLVNEVGGKVGKWEGNPQDKSQGCQIRFEKTYLARRFLGEYALRIDYDIQTSSFAFNGIWASLQSIDLSGYAYMHVLIKGDRFAGFPDYAGVEIKDSQGNTCELWLGGITGYWNEIRIPLQKNSKECSIDWKDIKELVIVFDTLHTRPKVGTLYVGSIWFSRETI